MKYSFSPQKLRQRINRIDYKKLFYRTLTLAVILLGISGYIAYTRLYLTPERRFWMAINNSLAVPSVVRSVENGGTGNKSTEVTRFVFGGQAAQEKINSVGFKNATSESNVTTDTITTPITQYVRYTNIFSTEKKADGSGYNFDGIKGVWAKQDDSKDPSTLDNQRLAFLQPLITLVPFGNLTPAARQSVVADLKNNGVYSVDYPHPTYQILNGQKYMTFSVKVMTKKYVAALQRYFTTAGYGQFPPLDPTGYPDNARVNSSIIVNMRDNSVAAISFNDSTENYGNYGVRKLISYPKSTVSVNALQSKLQAAQ